MATDLEDKQGVYDDAEHDSVQQHYDDAFNQLTSSEHYSKNAEEPAASSSAEDIADRENFYNPHSRSSDSSSSSPIELNQAEQSVADDSVGNGFNANEKPALSSRLKASLWGSKTRKRATIGTGIVGLLIGGGFGAMTYFAGPFEFIHLAQLLEQFHFSALQDASDDRFSKIARYIRDPAKPENTRLGALGNKLADTIESKMNSSGIESAYSDTFGLYDGYVVDTSNEKFKGMSNDEIKQYFEDNYGITLTSGATTGDPKLANKLVASADGLGYFKSRAMISSMMQEAGYSKISSTIGARIMGRRAGIDWHPIKKLDSKILRTVDDRLKQWRKNRTSDIENGSTPLEIAPEDEVATDQKGNKDPTGESNAGTAQNSTNEVVQAGQQAGTDVRNGSGTALSDLTHSTGIKLTGGAVAAVGVLCFAEGLSAHADALHQAEVVLPLMRIGMEFITVGNQTMSGVGADAEQLGFYSQMLAGKDSTGQYSTWDQAKSIQAEEGVPQTGPDIPQEAKVTNQDNWLSGILGGIPGLGGVCKAANSTFGQIFQIGIGFLGGPISAGIGAAVSATVMPQLESYLAHWMAGTPVDPSPVGADAGNYANYGARLAANDQAIAAGGTLLSDTQVAQLKATEYSASESTFKHQSIAFRLFNPYDDRTLVSKLIDNQNPDTTESVSNVASDVLGIGSTITKNIGSLFSNRARAATSYDYGFGQYGFSESDINNPAVENPFTNATHAATLLANNGQNGEPDYITRAQKCFGVTLYQYTDPSNNQKEWDVSGGQFGDVPEYKNIDGSDCTDQSPDWLSIRFFIFDTENMESAACYEGDKTSCQEVGFTGASLGFNSTAPVPSSAVAHLSKRLVSIPPIRPSFLNQYGTNGSIA